MSDLFDTSTWEDRTDERDASAPLELGREYVAIGPAVGTKLGPPRRITVVGLADDVNAYRVTGKGLAAPVVVFGAEHFWRAA